MNMQSRHPFQLLRSALLIVAVADAGACREPTRPAFDPTNCQQTYEFGNFGCSRIIVLVTPPAELPSAYRYNVRGVPARTTDLEPVFANPSHPGSNELYFIQWSARTEDTLSVWVVARVLDRSEPIVFNTPLPVVAADSVLRVIRFAPVGSKAPVDTVRLSLHR
jgi:hypothetical protein